MILPGSPGSNEVCDGTGVFPMQGQRGTPLLKSKNKNSKSEESSSFGFRIYDFGLFCYTSSSFAVFVYSSISRRCSSKGTGAYS